MQSKLHAATPELWNGIVKIGNIPPPDAFGSIDDVAIRPVVLFLSTGYVSGRRNSKDELFDELREFAVADGRVLPNSAIIARNTGFGTCCAPFTASAVFSGVC